MPEWLSVVILGIIEGITEFLPISSTGHLLLAEQWMPIRQTDTFLVVIQSGAVAAVLLIFKDRVKQLFRGYRDSASRDYLVKLLAAFVITAAGGLVLKQLDFELPETATPVGLALLIGGVLFLLVEFRLRGRAAGPGPGTTESSSHETIAWSVVVAMGIAQLVAAVFPGTSRSGATILIALMMGLSRPAAVEFSFLLGVPTLLSAGALKLVSEIRHPAGPPLDWGMLVLGTVVSAIVGFVAVRWLLQYLRLHTFIAFGWYRIAIGALVLAFAAAGMRG
jgi:undecaprenyl-diphosphatase